VNGTVDFFTPFTEHAEASGIHYHLDLISVEGVQYQLEGHKVIDSAIALSVSKTWQATTTINVNITRHDGAKVGSGVLHISLADFQKQMRTFRTTEAFKWTLLFALISFFFTFAYHISRYFFRPFVPMRFPRTSTPKNVDAKQPVSTSCKIKARDGVSTILDIYEPHPLQDQAESSNTSNLPPILFLPGITGTMTTHTLFALPLLRCNLVDYFTQRGHRCYILTPRWSCDATVAKESTVFDIRLDTAAAVQYVRKHEPQKPYVVAHCQGSVSLGMALLDGTIRRDQLLGVTANSVFMSQVFGYWNWFKGRTTLIIQFYEAIFGSFFPCGSDQSNGLLQRILDQILRFYPVGHSRDICTSTSCHRTSFAFGLLWNHDNLDVNIHENIHLFFGNVYTKMMKHLVRMGTKGVCLDNNLRPLLSTQSLQRLRGLPILFISGTDNQVFDPESTLKDYELLRRQFGEKYYRRFLAEGYGHIDPIIGKSAAEDTYWRMFAHMKWCIENDELSRTE
jgi:pimeloyl-ACP methyl ester carboxylesterase